MRRARFHLLALLLALSIAPGRATAQPGGPIAVGSLNLEWFGDSLNPRDPSEIAALARYIRSLELDVLCCQEINPSGDRSGDGSPDWGDLLDALGPPFEGFVGTTGSRQRLGLIWDGGRVALTDLGELRGIDRLPVRSAETFPRMPITAFVRPLGGGPDFRLITVHLFWTSDPARRREAEQLRDWLVSYLSTGSDPDVLILGDFNTKALSLDDPRPSQTVANLELGGWFTAVSTDHPEATTPTTGERYDHAFLSPSMLLGGAYEPGSWDVRREACEAFPEAYLDRISNHCPVSIRLIGPDLDLAPPDDWGFGPGDDSPLARRLAFEAPSAVFPFPMAAVPTPTGPIEPGPRVAAGPSPPLPSKSLPMPGF
ncbi:endonuclease/exonuclease/phosphatase family protein [Tautonia plasticadhaerens]|uniref:Endonuclease/Exonuclease/phosphatase family protein n=1 Tax=Tautonia plasticadhaerens TaxID=2527974 RepID=A0A518H6U1_9BACT|nr:endonuclease/exonuclease/phosphatase family protein [Tautonia plasticadhaerens]QDV36590.1 Endonuclease/Exonuclease/phosphatase family protein [Tautonia plasticadhaerens]